jgi:serine/threonine protein phosphatase PrpC
MYQQMVFPGTDAFQITAAGYTSPGRGLAHHEEKIAFCAPPDQATTARLGWLSLLTDGVSGLAADEIASRIAVETVSSVYYDQRVSQELGTEDVQAQGRIKHLHAPLYDLGPVMMRIRRAFSLAHTRILQQSILHPEYAGMATTCIATVVKGAHLLVAHIGDSRAYLLHPSSVSKPTLTRLTTDHTLAMEMARIEALSIEQMKHSPYRQIMLRALGGMRQSHPYPDIITCVAQAGDRLLLCSDGLWSWLTEEQIALVMQKHTPQVICDELLRQARETGEKDTISVVVLSFSQIHEKAEG